MNVAEGVLINGVELENGFGTIGNQKSLCSTPLYLDKEIMKPWESLQARQIERPDASPG
jgi:hypothetical protein